MTLSHFSDVCRNVAVILMSSNLRCGHVSKMLKIHKSCASVANALHHSDNVYTVVPVLMVSKFLQRGNLHSMKGYKSSEILVPTLRKQSSHRPHFAVKPLLSLQQRIFQLLYKVSFTLMQLLSPRCYVTNSTFQRRCCNNFYYLGVIHFEKLILLSR